MKNTLLILLLSYLPFFVLAQKEELSIFEPFIGKSWHAKAKWGNGSLFEQTIRMKYSLEGTIVIVETDGFVNAENTKKGHRNHGIRKYNQETKQIEFWEFDVFGGLTKGIVFQKENTIYYQYTYDDIPLTEAWTKSSDNAYDFKIGIYQDGNWSQVLLETQFTAKK